MTPTAIVAYLALFATVGLLFVLASLVLGKLLRSWEPTSEKVETYECGEPAVGPSSVQFDLRFYVVALVFLIFEVEVAFFFPPATVFGKVNRLRDPNVTRVVVQQTYTDLTVDGAGQQSSESEATPHVPATTLALTSMLDLGVFFAVLLVGFAFIWRCGDLDWVRAVAHPSAAHESLSRPTDFQEQPFGDRNRLLSS